MILPHFNSHLARYIEKNKCHGVDSINEKRDFVPLAALKEFWTPDKITQALCSVNHQDRIGHDASTIYEKYLRVFSILVSAGREYWTEISSFMDTQLDDDSLPLRQLPLTWADKPEKRPLYERFEKHQWKFCPYIFEHAVFQAKFPFHLILPFASKEKVDPEKGESDEVVIFKVKLHRECKGFIPVGRGFSFFMASLPG